MDRRLAGALLVVAVVATALVLPARDGLRIAGEATTIELPTEPRVGDCLLASTPIDPAHGPTHPAQPTDLRNSADDAPDFGPCNGQPVFGEVVAITRATGGVDIRRLRAETSGTDCRAAALTYAGLTAINGRYVPRGYLAPDPVTWTFSITIRTHWVSPSLPGQSSGSTWAACVVGPADGSSYVGVLAGAYSGGRLPEAFGVCWNLREVSVAIQKVDCRQPHLAELIAMGKIAERDGVTPSDTNSSCLSLAVDVMGRTDPTADGGLTVLIDPDATDSIRWTTEATGVVCYIVPKTHSLDGTVVGLRDRPVPYSG